MISVYRITLSPTQYLKENAMMHSIEMHARVDSGVGQTFIVVRGDPVGAVSRGLVSFAR